MIISDLHIHSRFAAACSKAINFANLEKYARIKGVNLLGTGDFQHPKWFSEINENLEEDENGILWSKNKFPFLWQTEISLMYSQNNKGRRVHYLIFAPNKDVAKQIIEALSKKGRLDYDGRPIFGFSSIELVDMMMGISKDIEIIPAHCMTPWFAIFGSKSGFNTIEECFKENSKYIHAIESGMSADPEMLRRVSNWDKYNIVSFSDMHSFWPWRLAREATVFDCELRYKNIINAIRTKKGLLRTIETWPAYGRYHYDGHRNCNVVLSPEETRELNGICPKCKRPLTIGVEYRIEELADRKHGLEENYIRLIPLQELIAAIYNIKQLNSEHVWKIYNLLIEKFGDEYNILLNVDEEELKKVVHEKLAKLIISNREGKLNIKAGYDGVYGQIILNEKIKKEQKTLVDY